MAERSDALKKAQQKYMERFAVARIRMERQKYEEVQEYAEKQGKSVNSLVVDLLDQAMAQDTAETASGGPQGAGVVSLPSEASKRAPAAPQGRTEGIDGEGGE